MADNTLLNSGSGGDTVASEDVSGVKYQRLKLVDATPGSTTPTGTSANALRIDPTGTTAQPVSGPLTDTQLRATAVPVSGTVTASGPLTDTQLRATAVPISGTVTANAGSGTQAVSLATLPPLVAGSANVGDVDVLTVPADPFGLNADASSATGSISAKLRFLAAGIAGATSLPAGANNIGDVDVLTIAAGTNRIGAAYPVSGQVVDDGGTLRTVNRAFANPTASGNTQVVAAQGAGVRIRVLSVAVVATAAVTVKFQSATTDVSAGMPVAANGGYIRPDNPHGWFQTNANEALNVNLSLATATGVDVTWVQAA